MWDANISLTYTRNIYNVVRQSDWADPTEGQRLKALLDRSTNGGWICTEASSLITSFGFEAIGSACGTLQAGI